MEDVKERKKVQEVKEETEESWESLADDDSVSIWAPNSLFE